MVQRNHNKKIIRFSCNFDFLYLDEKSSEMESNGVSDNVWKIIEYILKYIFFHIVS